MATPNALFAMFGASDPEALRARLETHDKFQLLSKSTSEESWFLIASNAVTTVELAQCARDHRSRK